MAWSIGKVANALAAVTVFGGIVAMAAWDFTPLTWEVRQFHVRGRTAGVWFNDDVVTVQDDIVRHTITPFGGYRDATRFVFQPLGGGAAQQLIVGVSMKCAEDARPLIWCRGSGDAADMIYGVSPGAHAVVVDNARLASHGVVVADIVKGAPLVEASTGALYLATTDGTSWRIDPTGNATRVPTSSVSVKDPRPSWDPVEAVIGDVTIAPGHKQRSTLVRKVVAKPEQPLGSTELLEAKILPDTPTRLAAVLPGEALVLHAGKMDTDGHTSLPALAAVRADGSFAWDATLAADLPRARERAAHVANGAVVIVLDRDPMPSDEGARALAVDGKTGRVTWSHDL